MKTFAVISHTHWDREWYMPLELFRIRLVDLIDRCLDTLVKNPEFIFHLDAQTVVFEDYLTIRPSKSALLQKYITEGRLIIGPWYVQNDFYLTSGESTIRNLMAGIKIANSFGKCSLVGYAPDQFGNISQLPQILSNFDIESFVFGRGFNRQEKNNKGEMINLDKISEFLWEGADGTNILAIHMPFWYNNAQRFSENVQSAKLLIEVIDNLFKNIAATPYILLMNGVDHIEAQDNLLPILDKLNKQFDDKKIVQYKLDEYVKDVKKYIDSNNIKLWKHTGQLRYGSDGELLKGTLSSRSYLKTRNVMVQNMMECKLEPLYSFLEMSGAKNVYPQDYLQHLWKELIKNHPHDSICGCSCDKVHLHMEDNYIRIEDTANELLRRGLQIAAEHMEVTFQNDLYVIILANTVEMNRSSVVEIILDFPVAENITNFTIFDKDDKKIQFDIISKERVVKDIFTPINLPGCLDVDRYHIYLYDENISGLAIKSYILRKIDAQNMSILQKVQELLYPLTMENEFLKVSVSKSGQVDIFHKKTEQLMENVIDLEETADRGDSYIYYRTNDSVNYGSDFEAEVNLIEYNDYVQKCRIRYNMIVPADYDFAGLQRSNESVICTVDIILCLKKSSEFIEIEYCVDNKAKCHRIRLLVDTGITSDESIADIPFDIIRSNEDSHFPDTMSKVLPNTSFALIENNLHGTAVFTEGTHEYEHQQDKKTLAFTLVRSTGIISRNGNTYQSTGGEQWDCPDNQCIRILRGRFAIMPYIDNYITANIPLYSKAFRNPVIPYFIPCDLKKFAGGRTAVQDSRLEETFYLDDPYKHIKIADNTSFIKVSGEGIQITAIKKSEDLSGIIIRLINLTNNNINAKIEVKGSIYITDMNEKSEEFSGENSISHEFTPKKILTLKVK